MLKHWKVLIPRLAQAFSLLALLGLATVWLLCHVADGIQAYLASVTEIGRMVW